MRKLNKKTKKEVDKIIDSMPTLSIDTYKDYWIPNEKTEEQLSDYFEFLKDYCKSFKEDTGLTKEEFNDIIKNKAVGACDIGEYCSEYSAFENLIFLYDEDKKEFTIILNHVTVPPLSPNSAYPSLFEQDGYINKFEVIIDQDELLKANIKLEAAQEAKIFNDFKDKYKKDYMIYNNISDVATESKFSEEYVSKILYENASEISPNFKKELLVSIIDNNHEALATIFSDNYDEVVTEIKKLTPIIAKEKLLQTMSDWTHAFKNEDIIDIFNRIKKDVPQSLAYNAVEAEVKRLTTLPPSKVNSKLSFILNEVTEKLKEQPLLHCGTSEDIAFLYFKAAASAHIAWCKYELANTGITEENKHLFVPVEMTTWKDFKENMPMAQLVLNQYGFVYDEEMVKKEFEKHQIKSEELEEKRNEYMDIIKNFSQKKIGKPFTKKEAIGILDACINNLKGKDLSKILPEPDYSLPF